jgi:hypothetical protein
VDIGIAILFAAFAGLIVLDILAMRYGVDSRDVKMAPAQGSIV